MPKEKSYPVTELKEGPTSQGERGQFVFSNGGSLDIISKKDGEILMAIRDKQGAVVRDQLIVDTRTGELHLGGNTVASKEISAAVEKMVKEGIFDNNEVTAGEAKAGMAAFKEIARALKDGALETVETKAVLNAVAKATVPTKSEQIEAKSR